MLHRLGRGPDTGKAGGNCSREGTVSTGRVSIELQVGTYGSCSVYSVPYNFSRKAYKGML